jgi:hypothetical protein
MRIVQTRIKRKHNIYWGLARVDPWNDYVIKDAFKYAMKLYRRFRRTTAEARIKSAIRMIDYQIYEFGKEMERWDRKEQETAKEKEEQECDGIPFTDDDIPF